MGTYTIVDLKGTSLSGSSATIKGIYNRIKNTDCAKLLTGINYGGTKYKDAFVKFTLSGTSYVSETIYGKVITVTNADGVTIANPG